MKRIILLILVGIVLLTACSSQTGVPLQQTGKNTIPASIKNDVPRIAVILPIQNEDDPMSDDIMIGINRIAQEAGGTIHGRKETIEFGSEVEFTILVTPNAVKSGTGDVITSLHGFGLEKYDIVICSGFTYIEPITAIHVEYPDTIFVGVDFNLHSDNSDNFLSLAWSMTDTTFIAGAIAAERFGGKSLGAIGGMDLNFIKTQFIGGFVMGVEYMDSLRGSSTEVMIDYIGSFNDYQRGYDLASEMYKNGVECIYQAAGPAGLGVLAAAADYGKIAIGVDTDQGLEAALRGDPSDHILTSTVKKWGNGVYLVCREYLTTGRLPVGIQVLGLGEGCTQIAINPYNAPLLGNQLETIENLRIALIAGEELPTEIDREEKDVWTSIGSSPVTKIITINNPVLSPGIPEYYGSILQEALSTEFHDIGFYRIINNEQVGPAAFGDQDFSLEGISEENTHLEVGRLIAAEAIVFVNLGEIGNKMNIDCKLVDVETGLTLTAARESYPDFESILDSLSVLVRELSVR